MEGQVCRWRRQEGSWRRCWMVLDRDRGSLDIYQSKTKTESQREIAVALRKVKLMEQQPVVRPPEDELSFSLLCSQPSRKILLQVETVNEKVQWMLALQSCCGTASKENSGIEPRVDEEEEKEGIDSDEEFYDADERLAPVISHANRTHQGESQTWEVEEDPDYKEREDISSSISQNKSVILHILSEARKGLDLTRMRLPAFILEKRSTLEMCSGFLAHPDIFAAIADQSNGRDRIVAAARFYCSSFHGTRASDTAKKPYNPVLGETFHCYWDLPSSAANQPPSDTNNIMRLVETGPVPYSNYNSVTFVAEQVSHHPPVSAFYAECLPKRMYVTGSVHTKIKFLGLSVGVYNTASVKLHLLDYGEEYTMTLPATYIRSLLTYPWMEFGGRSTISCPQTGFTATFDFHCKPFYGGKKHQVSCEISHKSEKQPFHRIEGEWNGVMYNRGPEETQGQEETFMDTIHTPSMRKKMLKLSAQDLGESRRRWQHVTEALAKGDIETASEAKHIVEEEQRGTARQRQEQGIEWTPKYFSPDVGGEGWVYKTPLSSRLQDRRPAQ